MWFTSTYVCLFCCHFMLSKYRIFCKHTCTAKIVQFSADYVICICVHKCFVVILCCQDVTLFVGLVPRWYIFWQIMLFTRVFFSCNHFMMSRCRIFRQHTTKMVHLSADHDIYMCVFALLSFEDVKMSHLLSAYRQNGMSFGRSCYLHVCICFVVVHCLLPCYFSG